MISYDLFNIRLFFIFIQSWLILTNLDKKKSLKKSSCTRQNFFCWFSFFVGVYCRVYYVTFYISFNLFAKIWISIYMKNWVELWSSEIFYAIYNSGDLFNILFSFKMNVTKKKTQVNSTFWAKPNGLRLSIKPFFPSTVKP